MNVDLIKLRNESREAIKLEEELKRLSQSQEQEIEKIKKKFGDEMDKIKQKIKNCEGGALYKKLFEMYNEIIDIKGCEYHPEFKLCGIATKGQKISTYEYFKTELEKLTGKQLVLFSFNTPFTRIDTEYEDYEAYSINKRLYDLLLMPIDVSKVLAKKAEKISLLEYYRVIERLPIVFLINRFWCEDNGKIGLEEENERTVDVTIRFNDYTNIYYDGIFEDSHYNKNNIEYENIVLNTFEYWYKGRKYEKCLKEKKEIEKRIKQIEAERRELEKKIKELSVANLELGELKSKNDDGLSK